MLVLGIDIETTGTNPELDKIVEIGVVLWDCETQAPISTFSELIYPGYDNPNIPLIHNGGYPKGLTPKTITEYGERTSWVLGGSITDLIHDTYLAQAKYFVAHNASFEKSFLGDGFCACLPWIDTMYDLPLEVGYSCRKVGHLASDYGLINPFPHRALFDVVIMMQLMSQFPLEEVLALQQSPVMRLVADVSYDDRDKAKAGGFRWDSDKKEWYKEGKQRVLDPGRATYPFRTTYVSLEGAK